MVVTEWGWDEFSPYMVMNSGLHGLNVPPGQRREDPGFLISLPRSWMEGKRDRMGLENCHSQTSKWSQTLLYK